MKNQHLLRRFLLVGALLNLAPCWDAAAADVPAAAAPAAAPKSAPAANATLDLYASPGQWVDIGGGRRLNLRCMGSGKPTVLLESGAIADSMEWSRVQSKAARQTRVCAYDRAGLGFSDGGPMPRDATAAVADLHALIGAAPIETPVVLVGHSLGALIARRYGSKYLGDVAGLVVIDPPIQNLAGTSSSLAKADTDASAARQQIVHACADAAAAGKLDHPTAALKDCLRGPDPTFSAKLNVAIRSNHLRAVYWQTLLSIFDTNIGLLNAPVSPSERHGAQPVLVLTATDAFKAEPAADRAVLIAARERTHQAIANTSKLGERIAVERSSHDIPADRPDAVIDAITKVVAQVRATAALPVATPSVSAHQPSSARPAPLPAPTPQSH